MLCGKRARAETVQFTHQFDEASQRLQTRWRRNTFGARAPRGQLANQVMVGRGDVYNYRWSEDAGAEVFEYVPYFCRSLGMSGQNTMFILAGILRQMPVPIADEGFLKDLSSEHRAVLFGWATDRCATNLAALRHIFDWIHAGQLLNVFPHCEPCNAHGVALTKNRAPGLKAVSAASHGFCRLMRASSGFESVRDAVDARVGRCKVVLGAPPPEVVAQRQGLVT